MSTFVRVDRDHNTPGVRVASNPTDVVANVVVHAGQDAHVPHADNHSVHVTQRSTGLTLVWERGQRSMLFCLAPGDELWMSASCTIVSWTTPFTASHPFTICL